MLYDVTGHPLLTEKAAELGTVELEAHARVAETLLKFHTFAVFAADSADYARAQDAVALQVSYQVEQGVNAFVFGSISRGDRAFRFRGGRRAMPIHTGAKKLASAIKPRTVTRVVR